MGERNVEDENRRGFDIHDPGGRLGERHLAAAAEDLDALLVREADLQPMLADLGALALQPEHEVQARVHRGELLHPDVLEDSQDGDLAGLVDESVVGYDGKVEVHRSRQPSAISRQSADG